MKLPLTLLLLPFALWHSVNVIRRYNAEKDRSSKVDRLERMRLSMTGTFILTGVICTSLLMLEAPKWLLAILVVVLIVCGLTLGFLSYKIALIRSGFDS